MDRDVVQQTDPFTLLLAQLLDAHNKEVADLKAEICMLRGISATVQQAGACESDEPTANAKMLPALGENLGQGGHATCIADSASARDEPLDYLSAGSANPERNSSSLESVIRHSARLVRGLVVKVNRNPPGLAAIRKKSSSLGRMDWSSWNSFFATLVKQSWFETISCVIILLNACLMAAEVQVAGNRIHDAFWTPGLGTARHDLDADRVFEACSWIFGVLFALEITIKIVGLRSSFGLDYWNWVDLTVCSAWAATKMFGDYLPVNSLLVRCFRLARLLRLLRLVRRIQGFDNLLLMTTAIRGSVSVLVWTCILLSLLQMVVALLLNQYLHDQYFDVLAEPDSDLGRKQQEVYEYYGTFTRAFFTTFEMTLANWPPPCRVLAENVSEWFFIFAVLYKLSMGFAVIGVVNGVFIQETFRVASIDDHIMMRQKKRAIEAHRDKMKQLFEEADGTQGTSFSDGLISREEWVNIVNDSQVKLWLSSMDLVTADAEKLFDMMDATQDGYLNIDELTMGVARLRGSARSIDLQVLLHEQQKLNEIFERIIGNAHTRAATHSDSEPPASAARDDIRGCGDHLDSKSWQAIPREYHSKPEDKAAIYLRPTTVP